MIKTHNSNAVKLTVNGDSEKTVILCKGGTGEKTVKVKDISIPDLWHIAHSLNGHACAAVLEVWHLAHDLKRELLNS